MYLLRQAWLTLVWDNQTPTCCESLSFPVGDPNHGGHAA